MSTHLQLVVKSKNISVDYVLSSFLGLSVLADFGRCGVIVFHCTSDISLGDMKNMYVLLLFDPYYHPILTK